MAHDAAVTERRFAWLALIAFAVGTAVLCSLHEPWHDELQAWRIALESRDLRDLLVNLRYEGHPPLFYAALRLIGFVSSSWTAAVVVHWMVACASAWVVLFLAPFTRLQRVLIICGYFVAYEYAVIVRPYGAGMLCALAACAAWCAPRRRIRTAIILLVLLANSSALGLVLSIPIGLAMLVDSVTTGGSTWWQVPANRRRAAAALALSLGTLLMVALLVMPPSDALYKGSIGMPLRERLWALGIAFSTPARVFAPFAATVADGSTAWSSWAFEPARRAQVVATNVAALLVVIAGAVVTSRRLSAFVLWLVACGVLLAFFSLIYLGSMRHHAHLVTAFLAAAWLAYAPRAELQSDPLGRRTLALERWRARILTTMLIPMAIVTVQVGLAELRQPFSDASAVAALIASGPYRDAPVVGMSYPWSQPVAALLGRGIYIPAEARLSTFVSRADVVEGDVLAARTDSVVQSLLRTRCEVLLLTGVGDTAHVNLRSARRLSVQSQTPMSGNPLTLWLVSAPRCAGR